MDDNEIMSKNPTTCPACKATVRALPYCESCLGVFATMTPEAQAAKAARRAEMKASMARNDDFLTKTIRRLADEQKA